MVCEQGSGNGVRGRKEGNAPQEDQTPGGCESHQLLRWTVVSSLLHKSQHDRGFARGRNGLLYPSNLRQNESCDHRLITLNP